MPIGAESNGRRAGSFGDAGCFGFYPNKQMTTGEGGVVATHSEQEWRLLVSLRNQGRSYDEGGFSEDYRMIARDGRVVWVHDETVLVRDDEGRPLFWQGVLYDISEQKRAEQEQQRADAEFLRQQQQFMMEQAKAEGWELVILSPSVDMSTPYGKAMAQMAAVFAELERHLISVRTREALAEKRRQGIVGGRPALIPYAVVARVRAEREAGTELQEIADGLNLDEVPRPNGNPWTAQAVWHLLQRLDREALAEGIGRPSSTERTK